VAARCAKYVPKFLPLGSVSTAAIRHAERCSATRCRDRSCERFPVRWPPLTPQDASAANPRTKPRRRALAPEPSPPTRVRSATRRRSPYDGTSPGSHNAGAPDPPFGADVSSMPTKSLTMQIWPFCAPAGWRGTVAGQHIGAHRTATETSACAVCDAGSPDLVFARPVAGPAVDESTPGISTIASWGL
jgi:hypothetical protein